MAEISSNSKRLAKNTVLLYLRTLIILAVSLYTSRVVINAVGIDDYGIYNIVGGFVLMFSILSGVLVNATQRFLSFEMGKKENSRMYDVFGAAMGIHIGISLILLLLFESFGLWFVNNKLVIPIDRLHSANLVFQFSVGTFLINVLSAPYNATIISHEKMDAFAYISLLDVFLKLAIAYLIDNCGGDKLIFYGFFLFLEALIIRFVYSFYCIIHFPETKFHIGKDIYLYKEMTGFASMTFLGRFASILSNQGVNVILNIFYGVAINAARGITTQVNSAIIKFVTDFTTALNPQITKRYAGGDHEGMFRMCCTGSKLSFYLLMFFAIPIIMRAPNILELWLKTYPPEAEIFVRLTMLVSFTTVLSNPLVTGILSTGNINIMCLTIGVIHLLTLPVSYFALKYGAPAYSVYLIAIGIDVILLFTRLIILCRLIHVSPLTFYKTTLLPAIAVVIPSFIIAYLINNTVVNNNFVGLIVFTMVTVIVNSSLIFFIGLSKKEKGIIKTFLVSFYRKFKKKKQ